ncbi:MAG TPA: tetratricopeptide repeat protein [Candidatus Methanoperedens sp.]|nr:tetratricopeptide repeat protein [Candidatus Methanoperedens sp.]
MTHAPDTAAPLPDKGIPARERLIVALGVLQRGILVSPGDPFLHFNLGRAYRRVGDAASARNELETLRKIDADAASVLEKLLDGANPVVQDP